MVNKDTLGIIFPNTYDNLIPELVRRRTMASVPFGSRYRMIDFTLSAMVNAGIDNVTVLAKRNYYSLMDHLGNGREWDLSRKLGGLNMVPPFAQSNTKMYHGRVEALATIVSYLEAQKEKYVILSDCNIASDVDYFMVFAFNNDTVDVAGNRILKEVGDRLVIQKADAAFACSLVEFEDVVRTGETLDRSESIGRGRADGDIRFRVPNQTVRFQPIHGCITLREQKPS